MDKMGDKVKVQDLDPPTQELLASLFKSRTKFARFGDAGCSMPIVYKQSADDYKNMAVRPDDTWVVTFPRSGTTLSQELVWLLKNDLDYDIASKIPLMNRYMFLERKFMAFQDETLPERLDPALLEEVAKSLYTYEAVVNSPSPRFIKTHMPLSLLPSNLLETTKVVYVARDPRDVAVSYHNLSKQYLSYCGDFKSFWNLFINDLVMYAPYFSHLKEAWTQRHHPNMLFIFYEDLIKDLPSTVKRIANFLDKKVSDKQLGQLCEHLDIKNFKKNESVNPTWLNQAGKSDNEGFVRKGKSGGWRDHFDEDMTAQAQKWMYEKLAGSDLCFADV